MNNAQLYLAVAIPSVLVILSWINNNARQTAMEKRIDSLDSRIDRLDAKLDRRFDDMIYHYSQYGERLAKLETK